MKNIFFILLVIPFYSFAQNKTKEMVRKGVDTTKYVPVGINIGDSAPKINATSLTGRKINSTEILQGKKIVLIFYRGKWCPYCNKFLSNLNDSLQYISDNNAEIIVIGPESFENTEKTADKAAATFVLIPDTTLQIQKDYDVLFSVTKKYQGKIKTFLRTDIAKNNNQKEATLPVPATYIIDTTGKIIWRYFDYDYSKRPSVKEIIDNLK
ncbi:MAG: redoxin domain-containing protein [Flavobacteriales bacterium]|nr:redoxin domain-containing protein [Flavobacteriales bacterium]